MDPVHVLVGALFLGIAARVGKHFYDRRKAKTVSETDTLRQQAVETNAAIWTATQNRKNEADLPDLMKWRDVSSADGHIKFDILTGQDKPEPVVTHDSVTTGAIPDIRVPDLSHSRMWLLRENRRCLGEINWEQDFFRPGEGTHRLRLLPAPPMDGLKTKTKTNFIVRKQHYITDDAYGKSRTHTAVQCARRLVDGLWVGECPLCDHWQHLLALHSIATGKGEHAEAEKYNEQARNIKAKERYYYNVIVYDGGRDGTGPLIWSTNKIVHGLIQQLANPVDGTGESTGEEPVALFDVQNGYDIRVRMQRAGMYRDGFPQYEVYAVRSSAAAGPVDCIERWMANLWDLEAVADKWDKTEAEMKAAMAEFGYAMPIVRPKKVETRCAAGVTASTWTGVNPTWARGDNSAPAILGLVNKTCVYCHKMMEGVPETVRFCSQRCLESQRAGRGCPCCGEREVVGGRDLRRYKCGYRNNGYSAVLPYAPCSTRVGCTCKGECTLHRSTLIDPAFYEPKAVKPAGVEETVAAAVKEAEGRRVAEETAAAGKKAEVLVRMFRCVACAKAIPTPTAPEQAYCSEMCLRNKIKAIKDMAGCWHCGETKIEPVPGSHLSRYVCGYYDAGGFLRGPCKTRPDCKCSHGTHDTAKCSAVSSLIVPAYPKDAQCVSCKSPMKQNDAEQVYCSEACLAAARRNWVPGSCPECGETNTEVITNSIQSAGKLRFVCGYYAYGSGKGCCKSRLGCTCYGNHGGSGACKTRSKFVSSDFYTKRDSAAALLKPNAVADIYGLLERDIDELSKKKSGNNSSPSRTTTLLEDDFVNHLRDS